MFVGLILYLTIMGLDLLFDFSVTKVLSLTDDGLNKFMRFIDDDEKVIYFYGATRDRVVFTDKRIITYNEKGLTGMKKEYHFFLYNKISAFSMETAGILDSDADFRIWCGGMGCFQIKMGGEIPVFDLCEFVNNMLSK